MNTLKQIEDDNNEDIGIEGDGNELNINDCSTLPSYSSFKNAIFPQLQPRMPQGIKKFPRYHL